MALETNIREDWRYFDFLKLVSLENPDGAVLASSTINFKAIIEAVIREAGTTLSGVPALKRAVLGDYSDADALQVRLIQARWHVWVVHLGNFVPQRNGRVIDAQGASWFINHVALETLGSRFALDTTLEGGEGIQ